MAESSGGKATLTAAGRAVANMPSRPATTKDLQERIFHLLGEGERKMLTLLIAAFPESVTRVELAGQAGYSNAKSGGFAAPLARLVELGFVESVRPGVVRGSEEDQSRHSAIAALPLRLREGSRPGHVRHLLHAQAAG